MFEPEWHKFSDEQPPADSLILISDGGKGVGLAVMPSNSIFDDPISNLEGAGITCYEYWRWNFDPTHWAKVDIKLPER